MDLICLNADKNAKYTIAVLASEIDTIANQLSNDLERLKTGAVK